jgi:hypothetical protein
MIRSFSQKKMSENDIAGPSPLQLQVRNTAKQANEKTHQWVKPAAPNLFFEVEQWVSPLHIFILYMKAKIVQNVQMYNTRSSREKHHKTKEKQTKLSYNYKRTSPSLKQNVAPSM